MSRFILFASFLFISASCDVNNSKSDVLDDVRSAKKTWETLNPQNYSYQFQTLCFCFFTEEVRVVVEQDSVVDVKDLNTNQTVMVDVNGALFPIHEVARSSFFTINEFYNQLEVQVPVADESSVTFDRSSGMPIEISFDYIEEAVDDEITYLFSNLNID